MVLNGHDHTYSRGHVPVKTSKKENSESLGAVYVTSVSGPKHYKLSLEQLKSFGTDGYELDKAGEDTQFFQVISIEDNNLIYTAYNTVGEKFDEFVLTKNFKTGRSIFFKKTIQINVKNFYKKVFILMLVTINLTKT